MKYWRAWTAVSIVSLGMTFMHFHRLAPTVIADHFMADFNLTVAGLGVFASAFFYSYAFMQIPAGRLLDQFGPSRVTTWGLGMVAVCTALAAWSTTVGWAIGWRVCAGIGASVFFSGTIKRITEVFPPHHFSGVHGIMFGLQNLTGLVILMPMASITTNHGWRLLFLLASAGALLLTAANAFVSVTFTKPIKLPLAGKAGKSEETSSPRVSLWTALRTIASNRQTWPPFIVFLGSYSPYLAFSGLWGIPMLMDSYQLSRESATAIFMFFAVGALFVPPLSGWLTDRLNSYRTPLLWGMGLCTWGWATLGCVLWLDAPVWLLVPPLILVGGCSLAFSPTYAVIKELHPPHLLGVATGLQNVAGFIGGLLLQPGLGWLIDYFARLDPSTQTFLPTKSSYIAAVSVSAAVVGLSWVAAFAIPHQLAASHQERIDERGAV